ncbi:hypothetical protein ACFPN2_21445 [Steroidobacter flavus]|uniref:Uncharacterized protein n=1 Tax=Steroidobacter flavus TaxID=1842136 RepID=A0ABV8SXB6_9GAMM
MTQPQLPELPPPPSEAEVDSLAAKEANAFANETLERRTREADHRRSERAKSIVVNAMLALFLMTCVLFALGVVGLAWHFLAPASMCWMSPDQLGALKGLVAGVILSGGVQALSKKYLSLA